MRFVFAVAMAILCLIEYAHSAPPEGYDPNSDEAKWYKQLRRADGFLCCDISDCRPALSRVVDDHYEAWIDDRWYVIPDRVVVHSSGNPTGSGVLCHNGTTIYCYVPGGLF